MLKQFKRGVWLAAALGGVSAAAIGAPAFAQAATVSRAYDIKSQPLGSALATFAEQSDLNLVFAPDLVRGKKAGTLKGRYTPPQALDKLLRGTGLRARPGANGNIVLERAPAQKPSAQTRAQPVPATAESGAAETGGNEIVVTAQKRSERLQDVPVPVAALSASTLEAGNATRLQDFYSKVPSVNFTVGVRGEPVATIRGITTGAATPTVGQTIDDVPLGASTNLGGGYTILSVDPADLDRVEVLRGPQGTLYGANSMGGLVKYVTLDPDPDRIGGRLQAGLESVRRGSDPGYSVSGAVNLPLSETAAIRASAFARRDPGYIDNIQAGETDVNDRDVVGGRISALWAPSGDVSVKLAAQIQDSDTHGSPLAFRGPAFGDMEQRFLAGTGRYHTKTQLYSGLVTADLGFAELVSVTGYSINDVAAITDYSSAFGGQAAIYGVSGAPLTDDYRLRKLSQEVRLTGDIGTAVEWLVGGFYTRERTNWQQDVLAADTATGTVVGPVNLTGWNLRYAEIAGFGDITIKLGERFDIQLGGRISENRQRYVQQSLIYPGPTTTTVGPIRSKDAPFTYLVTPRFRMSNDVMVYARFASGYRAGGTNAALGAPATYDADTTESYEVGVKASAFDRKLSLDASLFLIDWQNIQIGLLSPTSLFYLGNASEAKSQGVELSLSVQPVQGLKFSTWGTYNDAVLTEPIPASSNIVGADGSRLPYSAKYSGSASLDYEAALASDLTLTVGASVSYVGKRYSVFRGASGGVPLPRQIFDDYTRIDLRASLADASGLKLQAYINNVTDVRGELQGGLGFRFPTAFQYIQPRSIGLSLSKDF